jgi:hypothetical protein
VETEGKVTVPKHLQDGDRDARHLGHGQGYVYPHAEPGHHVGQQYLPTALLGNYFYSPSEEGYEAGVKDRLARWRVAQEKALGIEQTETLPELSESEVLDIKRRTVRRGEGGLDSPNSAVGANPSLEAEFERPSPVPVRVPLLALCADNAAMSPPRRTFVSWRGSRTRWIWMHCRIGS